MHGVSKISSDENIMHISFTDVRPQFMVDVLATLAQAGVVVDMISQTAPSGSSIRFSFTASADQFDAAIKALSGRTGMMISGGFAKLYLYGAEMVDSVGVAARALTALVAQDIEIYMITTSDMDISILVRSEDTDVALQLLQKAFEL